MNYLAHAFLSDHNKDLLIGNFIADHLRGNNFDGYSPAIIEGIYMHRRIDAFTDSHPKFKESKRFFYNGFEKHSGILVDIYFDHLLAKNFDHYSEITLKSFSEKTYAVYSEYKHLFPSGSSGFLDYVIKNNIYTAYSTSEGIERVLMHLSQRIRHQVRLDDSVEIFKAFEPQLQTNFELFFKDAIALFRTAGRD